MLPLSGFFNSAGVGVESLVRLDEPVIIQIAEMSNYEEDRHFFNGTIELPGDSCNPG